MAATRPNAAIFSSATLTSPGGREHNEDACAVRVADGRLCALVADGLGGHLGGTIASRLAVEAAVAAFETGGTPEHQTIQQIFAAANRAILERQRAEPDLRHMRTTLVALVALPDGRAWWAHAGDSRLYHFRGGRAIFRTADHSVPQRLADAGEIAPEQIRFHEDRGLLLRSLGSKPDPGATALAEPALLAPGDAFLLCSDGFWEWIQEPEMEAALRASGPHAATWLDTMDDVLKTRAEPGHDNYSAVAVLVGGNSGSTGAPETVV